MSNAEARIIPHSQAYIDFENELLRFNQVVSEFKISLLSDTRLRLNYEKAALQFKNEVLRAMRSGEITLQRAAEMIYETRESIRVSTRKDLTALAKKISISLEKPQTFAELLNKNSNRLFNKPFLAIVNPQQQGAVYMRLIERAVSNKFVNNICHTTRRICQSLWVLTFVIILHHIVVSDHKIQTALREGLVLGAAIGGGLIGLKAGVVCGPAAWLCSPIFSIVGGALGAYTAEHYSVWIKL